MQLKNKNELTLLQIVQHICFQHPELAEAIKGFALESTGFSYDFDKNGEAELLEKMAKLRPLFVFDVGANIGNWTKTALNLFSGAKIHAFELSYSTFKTLSKNVTNINVKLNNLGLSDSNQIVQYKNYGENSTVNTIILESTYNDSNIPYELATASVVCGDDYCNDNDVSFIDLLKIDVEGAEDRVLKGFTKMLEKRSIRAIQFEYGYCNGDLHFLMRDFYRFFSQYNYIVGRVTKGPIEFRPWRYSDNDFTSGPNWVAIRDDDIELKTLLSS